MHECVCVFVSVCHLCRVHLLAFQGSKQFSSYFTWSKGWAYDSFTEVVKLERNKDSVMFTGHLFFASSDMMYNTIAGTVPTECFAHGCSVLFPQEFIMGFWNDRFRFMSTNRSVVKMTWKGCHIIFLHHKWAFLKNVNFLIKKKKKFQFEGLVFSH